MKKEEIKGFSYVCMLGVRKEREHYKSLLRLGKLLPTSKIQAKEFIRIGHFDVLSLGDVEKIESLMNKHGLAGEYKYTKAKSFVRLVNINGFKNALKLEYLS